MKLFNSKNGIFILLCLLIITIIVLIFISNVVKNNSNDVVFQMENDFSFENKSTISSTTTFHINATSTPTPQTFVPIQNFTGEQLNVSDFVPLSNVDPLGSNVQNGFKCLQEIDENIEFEENIIGKFSNGICDKGIEV